MWNCTRLSLTRCLSNYSSIALYFYRRCLNSFPSAGQLSPPCVRNCSITVYLTVTLHRSNFIWTVKSNLSHVAAGYFYDLLESPTIPIFSKMSSVDQLPYMHWHVILMKREPKNRNLLQYNVTLMRSRYIFPNSSHYFS